MQMLGLVWGIVAILGMGVAFIPCLGALNWLNIPFSLVGLIISAVASSQAPPDKKNLAIIGIVLCAFAAVFGLIRLVLGGGIL
jgi:hypothetical protein